MKNSIKYKIIFLDIDGVLNNHSFISRISLQNPDQQIYIDDHKLKILNDIVVKTDAKLVLSSSWRTMFSDHMMPVSSDGEQLLCAFREFDLKLWDKTDSDCGKAEAINRWLRLNGDLVDTSVILDDDYLDVPLSKLVRCSYYIGLTETLAEAAIRWLSGE